VACTEEIREERRDVCRVGKIRGKRSPGSYGVTKYSGSDFSKELTAFVFKSQFQFIKSRKHDLRKPNTLELELLRFEVLET
jgi:hypothetical protein